MLSSISLYSASLQSSAGKEQKSSESHISLVPTIRSKHDTNHSCSDRPSGPLPKWSIYSFSNTDSSLCSICPFPQHRLHILSYDQGDFLPCCHDDNSPEHSFPHSFYSMVSHEPPYPSFDSPRSSHLLPFRQPSSCAHLKWQCRTRPNSQRRHDWTPTGRRAGTRGLGIRTDRRVGSKYWTRGGGDRRGQDGKWEIG